MANLTISVDDVLLKRARIKALEDGTSVNALLREYLEAYTGTQRTQRALAGFAELAERSEASSGATGRTWTRDELHDRPTGP
jgi:plasmid stability protein